MAKTNWQTYNEFNQARYKIQDNELERIISANLNKTQWTKDKFELFNSYNFVDYTSFEGKELNSLIKSVDYLETTKDLEFNDLLNRWKTYANYFYYLFFVSVLLIIYSIIKQLFLHNTVKNHLVDMSSILLFVIVWVLLIIYITTYLRLPERIVFPILSTLTYGVILNEFRSSSVKQMTQLKNSSIVIQTFLIIIIFFCVNLDFYKIYNLRINPAYRSFWSEQRISLLALNEGKIFIGNASQVKSVWSNPYKINTVLRELNYLPLGWYTFSPYWNKRAHNLGLIGNSVLNNINSNQNIYWLSDDEYTNYLINHNNDLNGIKLIPTKVMTKTFDFGEYSVYRFTRSN